MAPPAATVRLAVEGMTCASCTGRVERALQAVPGVLSVRVNLADEAAYVAWSGGPEGALVEAVEEAGYDVRVAAEEEAPPEGLRRDDLITLAALVATAPLVLPMVAMPFGLHLMPPDPVALGLGAFVQVVAGWRFTRGAWAALRAGTPNMDVLVALGSWAAFALSAWHAVVGGPLYVEASAAIVAFVRGGKALEARARRQTGAAVRALRALRPAVAHLLRGEGAAGADADVDVPADAVPVGARVRVRPGERVPVDGEVVEGASELDVSLLTGESEPVRVAAGAAVPAGAGNGTGVLVVRATAVGEDATVARIARLVDAAAASRPAAQQLADRVAAVFVPAVLALAALTGVVVAALGGSPDAAILRAVAVLVVACPCALGLATPAALLAGTGAAARLGVLVADADALSAARRVTTVVFDKTGTLTAGRPRLEAVVALSAAGEAAAGPPDALPAPAAALLAQVAAVQAGSEHPQAAAVREAAVGAGGGAAQAASVEAVPGRGVRGVVAGPGGPVALTVGSRGWLAERGLEEPAALAARADAAEATGATVTWITVDDRVAGLLLTRDALRPEAAAAVAALRADGHRVVVLSGDRRPAAEAVGEAVGADAVLAEVLPEGKVAALRALQAQGEVVAFVGDGLNDAPALAAADVGVAMGTGSDAALAAAHLVLARADVRGVRTALAVGAATDRTLRGNLAWAFAYNVLALPAAALGYLSPVLAGAAMALSSVSVLANALRLTRFTPPATPAPASEAP